MLALTVATASAYYGARFEPPDGFIYHGCGWDGYSSQAYYLAMFPPDHHPLVLQVVADMPGTRWFDVSHIVQSLTRNIVHPDSQYIEYGIHFRGRDTWMLDSVFALTTTMDHYIDTLAIALRTVNRPFFLRIGFEFNGWWNPYHPYIYPLAFRKLVTELRQRGVPEFATVWCYEPDAPADFADSTAQGWKWYPGDDVVDWCGLDPFLMEHFNPALPDTSRGQLTPKGRSESFLRFAQSRRKPVYLDELSASHVYIVPDSLDPQGDSGRADWNYWFAPFFQFVANHPDIKGWNYINLDWTRYETYREWGDARLEINTEIRTRWVDSLMSSRFLNAGYDVTAGVNEPGARTQKTATYAGPTVVRGTLSLPHDTTELPGNSDRVPRLALLDATGRRVAELHSGLNDVSHLAPGVYFAHATSGVLRSAPNITKVIVAR
jgi:Glycosyl hydrolase family 26